MSRVQKSGDIMTTQQTKRRAGRPPKYDWSDKRDVCYRLYVEEKKSADKIIKYFTEHFQIDVSELPCRKGFLRQFELWGFPSHRQRLAPEEEARATARIKGLWERNISQRQIRQILEDEGHTIGKHEFGLLWKRNGFRLRNDQGYKAPVSSSSGKKRGNVHVETSYVADVTRTQFPSDSSWQAAAQSQLRGSEVELKVPDEEEAAARTRRLYELQAESDQKLQTGKRRRRIRGFGPFPPDAPGSAPRYASETSLDECKAYLHLSNEMYVTVRADFETICNALGIVKKTHCAEGIWEESKNRLVRENLHLSAMMHPLQPDQGKKSLALDCICVDVTKRMRAASRVVTIADANNYLNFNPTESKAVRRSLYEILESHNFESRLICGEQRWDELRQEWLNTSEVLQSAADADDPMQLRSVEVLCRDTLKRYRDDRFRRGERAVMRSGTTYGPGPGPARPVNGPRPVNVTANIPDPLTQPDNPLKIPIREPRVSIAVVSRGYYAHPSGNLLMSLAQTTGNINFDIDPTLTSDAVTEVPGHISLPISAYFFLEPGSNIVGNHPQMWLGKLASPTLESLHQAATSRLGAAKIARVHGLIINSDGFEDRWLVEKQDELTVYLREAGEKPKFAISFQAGYA